MKDWLETGWVLRLREQLRKMWVRVILYSLAGVALALVAPLFGPVLNYIPKIDLAAGSVDALLNIIATTMLAVTTFSMSIIVGAYGSATSNATPRATRLLEEDRTAQNAVSIFIGSFLFSIVGIVGLSAGFYPGDARVLLFVATLGDIALIAWALVRWVSHLNEFGRMSDIISRIEQASLRPAQKYRDRPALGAVPQADALPEGLPLVASDLSGYVRYVDVEALQFIAEQLGIKVEIRRMPGKYVHRGEALLRLTDAVDDEGAAVLRAAFVLGEARSFDQDLAYGLTVLCEVASKALSPGINDPGTAIEVLRAGTRVLEVLHGEHDKQAEVTFDLVYAPPLDAAEVYSAFFAPIARDGAALLEVQETLLDCLAAVERFGDSVAARREMERVRQRARAALSEVWELEVLSRS